MPTVTLGGDRLGSGNKMKVDMKTYDRSTHNLSEIFRSTMSAGTLVPCYKKFCLPGDRWEIELDLNQMTHPTEGPLFGSYKSQTDAFIVPIRLYNAKLHMNMIDIGRNMSQIKLPQIQLTAERIDIDEVKDLNNCQINPSSVHAYLGIRGVGIANPADGEEPVKRYFNSVPYLGLYEIAKQYYWNKQEEIGAVIHSPVPSIVTTVNEVDIFLPSDPSTARVISQAPATTDIVLIEPNTLFQIQYLVTPVIPNQIMLIFTDDTVINAEELTGGMTDIGGSILSGTIKNIYAGKEIKSWRYRIATDTNNGLPIVTTFPLANIDTMRQIILEQSRAANAFIINEPATDQGNLEPYKWLDEKSGDLPFKMSTQEGLPVKTYQSDLHNNWLNTEWIDGTGGITEVTAVDTSDGQFTLDQLNLAKKVYNMLNRIAVSGGTYKDWIDVTYTETGAWRADNPIYLGSLIKELIFQEVISNSASADQPLGTLAGRGVLSQGKHKGGYINFTTDEPAYLIIVTSLTPRIDYSQGNDWDMHLETMDDFHKAALDGIGFQELITEQMAWWDTNANAAGEWVTKSAGKQPAWINYMTSINKTYGNFAIEDNEMFMTLNRKYEYEVSGDNISIKDLTTYIDPVKYNSIFAVTSIDAQNFWTQIRIDAKVRRIMSGKLMPIV